MHGPLYIARIDQRRWVFEDFDHTGQVSIARPQIPRLADAAVQNGRFVHLSQVRIAGRIECACDCAHHLQPPCRHLELLDSHREDFEQLLEHYIDGELIFLATSCTGVHTVIVDAAGTVEVVEVYQWTACGPGMRATETSPCCNPTNVVSCDYDLLSLWSEVPVNSHGRSTEARSRTQTRL